MTVKGEAREISIKAEGGREVFDKSEGLALLLIADLSLRELFEGEGVQEDQVGGVPSPRGSVPSTFVVLLQDQ